MLRTFITMHSFCLFSIRVMKKCSHQKNILAFLVLAGLLLVFLTVITEKLTGHNNNNYKHGIGHQLNYIPVENMLDNTEIKPKCGQHTKSILVNINNLKDISALYIEDEVYIPFTFLKEYYQLGGTFETKEKSKFSWRIAPKDAIDIDYLKFEPYSVKGVYLSFHESDVPNRSRVKCICGKHEVPVTTQWNPAGYYYPTQIAQYGLSHLSKYYNGEKTTVRKKIEVPKDIYGSHSFSLSEVRGIYVINVRFKSTRQFSAFEINVLASDSKEYTLRYKANKEIISRDENVLTHDIPSTLLKSDITRDLNVDLVKGLSFVNGKKQGITVEINIKKLKNIIFSDSQYVEDIVFMDNDHVTMFLSAADWFISFQDMNGGWKTNTSRVVFKGMSAPPGWYSAMGQGQAISLLCRVYEHTGDRKYLDAALKATKVFHVFSENNGVRAMLFGKHPWYEEYPVVPSLYVLNGFMYSLFGLYDLYNTAGPSEGKTAKALFKEGVKTLEIALPLFDNGQGSFYDLRHVSVPGISPNRARWQYHRLHLEQLSALFGITHSKVINSTLTRWIGYVYGILSRHN